MKDTTPSHGMSTSAPLSYTSYLKVDELLRLQAPLSVPVAHDELLFIVTHQVYELWFKVVLFELETAIRNLESDNLIGAFKSLSRISEVFSVLIQQVDILETMTPNEFNQFRSHINPASGFQSLQFRELEILSGAALEEYDKFQKLMPEWANKLTARANEVTLRQALIRIFHRRGILPKGKPTPEALKLAVLWAYENPQELPLQTLCEYLIGYDEQFQLWRFRHVQMVERMIGLKPGTGGSLGVPYLAQTLKRRYFPELWESRTSMGAKTPYGGKSE